MDPVAVGAWATVILALGTAVSVIFLARQLRSDREAAERAAATVARASALRLYAEVISPRLSTFGVLPPDRSPSKVREAVDRAVPAAGVVGDLALCEAIHRYLSDWELVGVGVRTGVLDSELLREMVGGRVRHIVANYADFVARERVRLETPELYEALDWLVDEWAGSAAPTPAAPAAVAS